MIGIFLVSMGLAPNVQSQATTHYLGDHLIRIQRNTFQAMNAQSLEALQGYARKTMEAATAFQRAAQSVNDDGFVSQAVDIYTYAQRATLSSTYSEAYEYMARAASYVKFSSDQAEERPYEPQAAQPQAYHDFSDVSYRNYYDHNFDVVFYEPEQPYAQ